MEFHSRDMFLPDKIDSMFSSELKEKEILVYKLSNIENQINEIKKINFKELFIYETKKKTDKNLIPNKDILIQIKVLERDDTYLSYKREIEDIKTKIKKIDNQIENKTNELNVLFSFVEQNLYIYSDMYSIFLNNKTEEYFNHMMEFIFNIEFNDKKLYKKLRIQRNYNIFELLVEKSPTDFQSMFKFFIYQIQLFDYNNEQEKIIKGIISSPEDIIIDMRNEYKKLLEEIK